MKINSLLELIGNTPNLRLNKLFPEHEIWIKLERQNPGGSIKDRISLGMIEAAENDGALKPGGTLIEATSGNTGIGLAWVGPLKGYQVKIVMPESQSIERRKIITAYGADLVLTPKEEGIDGAIKKAQALRDAIPGSIMLEQFSNRANIDSHKNTTALEIVRDFDRLDYLFAAFGTGGHISALADILKEHIENLKVVAVDPSGAPTLSEGNGGSHNIPGIGPGFIPDNLIVDSLDRVAPVSDAEAFAMTRRVAREEGLFAGVSTGAVLAAVEKQIKDGTIAKGDVVLTFNYDTGERYLSIEDLF
ncbi:MAG: cysteine synthase family protein [Candidatus Nitrohelix vancouverensis]|uniref:Cysteine synthase family protein n=1 Tax=Candidatus Nitrohelix vancouverensis TaxID=2705534 RepID=A0A7T0C0J9_9BACT|nr:MAG: cysteine synthase family protein [Candidatus Nitrohelix vancouverensis]